MDSKDHEYVEGYIECLRKTIVSDNEAITDLLKEILVELKKIAMSTSMNGPVL